MRSTLIFLERGCRNFDFVGAAFPALNLVTCYAIFGIKQIHLPRHPAKCTKFQERHTKAMSNFNEFALSAMMQNGGNRDEKMVAAFAGRG